MTITRRSLNPDSPPPLSAEAKARYDATSDEDIDYTDIPDMGDVDWDAFAVDNPLPKPTVTMRLPEDVISFFKADGAKGYTQRMAAVITAYARSQAGKE